MWTEQQGDDRRGVGRRREGVAKASKGDAIYI